MSEGRERQARIHRERPKQRVIEDDEPPATPQPDMPAHTQHMLAGSPRASNLRPKSEGPVE
ncbi:MAG TPA: hypothetical protein VG943_18275 [Caulobacterales bacterium]|nr:hypothetical protein [Caulobacterales bacterium]